MVVLLYTHADGLIAWVGGSVRTYPTTFAPTVTTTLLWPGEKMLSACTPVAPGHRDFMPDADWLSEVAVATGAAACPAAGMIETSNVLYVAMF
jgi:hypothetical protein